jgi:hypothetical protein
MIDERRGVERLPLRLPVLLLRPDAGTPISGETANINHEGFYCITSDPLSPGDRVACLIALPVQPSSSAHGDPLYIEGQVEVIRLVEDNDAGFGIGCRIFQYHVITEETVPAWARAVTLGKRLD